MSRSSAEIRDEMFNVKPTVEDPWTWRDKLVMRLTGHVSARVYAQRMAGMYADDRRAERLAAEYHAALKREQSSERSTNTPSSAASEQEKR